MESANPKKLDILDFTRDEKSFVYFQISRTLNCFEGCVQHLQHCDSLVVADIVELLLKRLLNKIFTSQSEKLFQISSDRTLIYFYRSPSKLSYTSTIELYLLLLLLSASP